MATSNPGSECGQTKATNVAVTLVHLPVQLVGLCVWKIKKSVLKFNKIKAEILKNINNIQLPTQY